MNYPVCGNIYFPFPHVEVLPCTCIFVQIDEKWLLIQRIICKLETFPCTVPFSILENVAKRRNFYWTYLLSNFILPARNISHSQRYCSHPFYTYLNFMVFRTQLVRMYHGVSGSNRRQYKDYPDWAFYWFSSDPPGKCRNGVFM